MPKHHLNIACHLGPSTYFVCGQKLTDYFAPESCCFIENLHIIFRKTEIASCAARESVCGFILFGTVAQINMFKGRIKFFQFCDVFSEASNDKTIFLSLGLQQFFRFFSCYDRRMVLLWNTHNYDGLEHWVLSQVVVDCNNFSNV